MPRITHAGFLLPGISRAVDRAGWQCTSADLDEPRGRCRLIATHTHRRRDGNRVRVVALCRRHYEAAGPEAAARR